MFLPGIMAHYRLHGSYIIEPRVVVNDEFERM
jgi:hypothetical protein